MAINWYPGHMHKARKEMLKVLPQMDVIIEMTDARIPHSSINPVITELATQKPCIKLLSKSDLADPQLTSRWQEHWLTQHQTQSLAITTEEPARIKQLPDLIRKLVPNELAKTRKIQALIVGIPNVGKSTLINYLLGRPVAKTGNEPAVTKAQQKLKLSDDIMLNDTPGILWPKFENSHSGYRLAITGAIRDTAIDYQDIALYLIEYLAQHYPDRLRNRYQIAQLPDANDVESAVEILEQIGANRGAKASGGRINLHKAAEVLVHDYRSANLGTITLESPTMIQHELTQLAEDKVAQAAKDKQKQARKAKKKKGIRH